jgi:hypothetical protein
MAPAKHAPYAKKATYDVIHWIDNTSALYSAVKGYSGAPDIARVVAALQSRWLSLGLNPWLEFVKSEANLSDDPFAERVDAEKKWLPLNSASNDASNAAAGRLDVWVRLPPEHNGAILSTTRLVFQIWKQPPPRPDTVDSYKPLAREFFAGTCDCKKCYSPNIDDPNRQGAPFPPSVSDCLQMKNERWSNKEKKRGGGLRPEAAEHHDDNPGRRKDAAALDAYFEPDDMAEQHALDAEEARTNALKYYTYDGENALEDGTWKVSFNRSEHLNFNADEKDPWDWSVCHVDPEVAHRATDGAMVTLRNPLGAETGKTVRVDVRRLFDPALDTFSTERAHRTVPKRLYFVLPRRSRPARAGCIGTIVATLI